MIEAVDLAEKFSLFSEHWHPKIVGQMNDHHVKLAKLKGAFVWHRHDQEDELFLVIKGLLKIRLRDQDLVLGEGQFAIIPRGVEHLPVARDEAWVMLFEPQGTLNTGEQKSDRTVEPEWI